MGEYPLPIMKRTIAGPEPSAITQGGPGQNEESHNSPTLGSLEAPHNIQ